MSPAWLGFIKLVSCLACGISVVGALGFVLGGWDQAIVGGVVGALGTLYGIRSVVARSRSREQRAKDPQPA